MRHCLAVVLRAAIWPAVRWFAPSAHRGWRCWRCGILGDLDRPMDWGRWYCPLHQPEDR